MELLCMIMQFLQVDIGRTRLEFSAADLRNFVLEPQAWQDMVRELCVCLFGPVPDLKFMSRHAYPWVYLHEYPVGTFLDDLRSHIAAARSAGALLDGRTDFNPKSAVVPYRSRVTVQLMSLVDLAAPKRFNSLRRQYYGAARTFALGQAGWERNACEDEDGLPIEPRTAASDEVSFQLVPISWWQGQRH